MKQTKTLHAFVLFRFDPKWNGETNRSKVIGKIFGDERNVRTIAGSELEESIAEQIHLLRTNGSYEPSVSFYCELDTTYSHYLIATKGTSHRLWQCANPAKSLLVVIDSQNVEAYSPEFLINKRFDVLVDEIARALPTRKLLSSAVFFPDNALVRELTFALAYSHVQVFLCGAHHVKRNDIEYMDWNVDSAVITTTRKLVRQHKPQSVCIVSGDGDFIPMAEELQGQGIEVGVACLNGELNRYLRERAQYLVFLDAIIPILNQHPQRGIPPPPRMVSDIKKRRRKPRYPQKPGRRIDRWSH